MSFVGIAALPGSAFVDQGDTTLLKCTRPTVCAVCRNTVTASIVLPEDLSVCESCACVALRFMIFDAEACRGGGSGAFRPSGGGRT